MPPIDIDRDGAHDTAQQELDKPIYPRASLTERFMEWLDRLLFEIMAGGASVPGGWLTIIVLLVVLGAAVFVAIHIARRTMRTSRGHPSTLFGSQELSSGEHRGTAERFAASGDWASAIRHRLRAVARHLEETAVLNPAPGRTATELARDAGLTIPGLSPELRSAAEIFNDVTYGGLPGTERAYRAVADLDDHICARVTTGSGVEAAALRTDGWVEVR